MHNMCAPAFIFMYMHTLIQTRLHTHARTLTHTHTGDEHRVFERRGAGEQHSRHATWSSLHGWPCRQCQRLLSVLSLSRCSLSTLSLSDESTLSLCPPLPCPMLARTRALSLSLPPFLPLSISRSFPRSLSFSLLLSFSLSLCLPLSLSIYLSFYLSFSFSFFLSSSLSLFLSLPSSLSLSVSLSCPLSHLFSLSHSLACSRHHLSCSALEDSVHLCISAFCVVCLCFSRLPLLQSCVSYPVLASVSASPPCVSSAFASVSYCVYASLFSMPPCSFLICFVLDIKTFPPPAYTAGSL